jgi:hypothetical protein
MPFPLIEFDLTDEQLEKLKPFADQIVSKDHATVLAEIFVHPTNYNHKRVVARMYDAVATQAVSAVLVSAQKDYDIRHARAKRLRELRAMLISSNATAEIVNETVVIRRDGYEYELRETKAV